MIALAALIALAGQQGIPTGSLIRAKPEASATADAIAMRKDFAECAYARRQQEVEAVFNTLPDSIASNLSLRSAALSASQSCRIGGSQLQMNPLLMRGAFAEAYYVKAFAATPAASDQKIDPTQYWRAPNTKPKMSSQDVMRVFAACVVDRDPVALHGWMRSDPRSTAGKAAFASVTDDFSPCLPAAYKLPMTFELARSVLAEAMVHRATDSILRIRPVPNAVEAN